LRAGYPSRSRSRRASAPRPRGGSRSCARASDRPPP
jgi:hypothetical protein